MRYEEKIVNLVSMHESLLDKLRLKEKGGLPKNVDREKLEEAYDSLKGYVFVLKKA